MVLMSQSRRNLILLIAGMVLLYGGTAVVLLQVLPGPHTASDLMVIGSVATFASLIALFVFLILTWFRRPDPFFRRRKR